MRSIYQDKVEDTKSNEESANTNILINRNERRAWRGSRKCKQTEKIAAYNREGQKKKARLSLGIHVGKVSEKGKVPRCLYCRGDIENRGEWHMIKVSKSGPEERWGKNEHHFHFKCAKGGLDKMSVM